MLAWLQAVDVFVLIVTLFAIGTGLFLYRSYLTGSKAADKSRKFSVTSSDKIQVRQKQGGSTRSSYQDGPNSDASKWDTSKRKGQLGYYYAHHTAPSDGIASHEYQMNGPKLLSKEPARESPSAPAEGVRKRLSVSKGTRITGYSWEDRDAEVKLTFRQDGWDWALVQEEDVTADWDERSVSLAIDSQHYGLHTFELANLFSRIQGVRVRKMKRSLVVAMSKKYGGPWSSLQAAASVKTSVEPVDHEPDDTWDMD